MKEKIIFAGGCFWGVQYYFDQVPGVIKTVAGYTGGSVKNPTYEQVCSGVTGHTESVEIEFDSEQVSLIELVKHFFRIHDPTRADGQGLDIGDNYRPANFYYSEEQKKVVLDYINNLGQSSVYKKPIVTEVVKASEFWPAEDYHQKFAERTGRGICHVAYEPIK